MARVGVELFTEGTLGRTRVNEIIKRAGVSRTLFHHYSSSKMVFARTIVKYEALRLHDPVEQQTALTLERAIFTFAGYVKARPDNLQMLHTGGPDQDPEVTAALATSFERYERLVLMLMGIPEPDARAMFIAHVWTSAAISLCLVWLDHPEISQKTITNMSAQTLRSLVFQVRQGAEHTPEPTVAPATAPEPVNNHRGRTLRANRAASRLRPSPGPLTFSSSVSNLS